MLCRDKQHLNDKLIELWIRVEPDGLMNDIYWECEPYWMLEPDRLTRLIE